MPSSGSEERVHLPVHAAAGPGRELSRPHHHDGLVCHGLCWGPIVLLDLGVASAAFVSNITATYYSREKVWSTPYTLLFGEPFPDASIVVPFGCGALVLLDKDDRAKFQSRCALLVFIHYATAHPLYTYAFYSPRTKRVLYRQDAIFLVTTFPLRTARVNAGMPASGAPVVAFRSPLASLLESSADSPFHSWKTGDALPIYEDHVTGVTLVADLNSSRQDSPDFPLDWPRRYPYHPSFGSRSTVSVPLPVTLHPTSSPDDVPLAPLFELDSPPLAPFLSTDANHVIPEDPDDSSSDEGHVDLEYSVRDRDRDFSRGMGHHLRLPVPSPSTGSKRRHDRSTSDFLNVVSGVVPPPVPASARTQSPALPEVSRRSLRTRKKASPTVIPPVVPVKGPRVPVSNAGFTRPSRLCLVKPV